jgi:pimeloyl-ACP methyl ester carboxylesterase
MPSLPHFEPIPASQYPAPEGIHLTCGYLTVPETRTAASGPFPSERTLRLYVTVVKSLSPNPAPDPVVVLNGGPGGNSRWCLSKRAFPILQETFLQQRDLILLDQRGTGFSEPALFAPEIDKLSTEDTLLGNYTAEQRAERFIAALLQAREGFVAAGINLTAFNTPEIAADVEDLRQALGYAQINLYSISYGTRPALALLRDYPASLRSVVLDSTVPIQVSQYAEAIPNAAYAFHRLFDAVAADPPANAVYPDLQNVFYATVERLNQQPALIPSQHPTTGAAVTLRLTGELFLGFCCMAFYSGEAVRRLPALIQQVASGDYQALTQQLTGMLEDSPSTLPGWSIGMYFSVNYCDDKVDAATAATIAEAASRYPAYRSLPLTEFHLGAHIAEIGRQWGARVPGPAEAAPVVSDIPTLILAGEFDQNTPAFWGKLAGETLPNSHYLEFPGCGHGQIGESACGPAVIKAFLADPWTPPAASCLEELKVRRFVE